MGDLFIELLSRPTPNPGGGAAAAYGARVGIALLVKILRLELSRHQGAFPEESFWKDLLASASELSEALSALQEEDGRAYLKLVEAKARSAGSRDAADALKTATDCPFRIMERAVAALDLCKKSAGRCRKHLLSDLMAAGELLFGACRGVRHIAESNAATMRNEAQRALYAEKIADVRGRSERLLKEIGRDVSCRLHSANGGMTR